MNELKEFLHLLPKSFIPLFVAMDVFWLLAFFAPYTEGREAVAINRLLRLAITTALMASLLFIAVGGFLFGVLGITVHDFKVAGGLLLLLLAITDVTGTGRHTILDAEDSGAVPLGIPLIVGPAVLTTLIVHVEQYGPIVTVTALILNLGIVWLTLHFASRIVKLLGREGVRAMSKIMSILLASIAVMMIRRGLQGLGIL